MEKERIYLTMKRRLPAIVLAFALMLTVCTTRVYSQVGEPTETDSLETAIQEPDEDSLDLPNDDIPESSVTDLEDLYSDESEPKISETEMKENYTNEVLLQGIFDAEEADALYGIYKNDENRYVSLNEFASFCNLFYNDCGEDKYAKYRTDEAFKVAKAMFVDGLSTQEIRDAFIDSALANDDVSDICRHIGTSSIGNDETKNDTTGNLTVNETESEEVSARSKVEYELFASSSGSTESTEDENIYAPFSIGANNNEEISPQKGNLDYTAELATVKGINGKDVRIALKYDSSKTWLDSWRTIFFVNGNVTYFKYVLNGSPRLPITQICNGWNFDLPYITSDKFTETVIYVPGDGKYNTGASEFISTMLYPNMEVNGATGIRKITFGDGRIYWFYNEKHVILREEDRFGNKINYFYDENTKLTKITDAVGRDILFTYENTNEDDETDSSYVMTVALPNENTVKVYFGENTYGESLKYFTLDKVVKTNGEENLETLFDYYLAPGGHGVKDDGTVPDSANPYVLLNKITYPTGGETRYAYSLARTQSHNTAAYRVSERKDCSENTEFEKIEYVYPEIDIHSTTGAVNIHGDCTPTKVNVTTDEDEGTVTVESVQYDNTDFANESKFSTYTITFNGIYSVPVSESVTYHKSSPEMSISKNYTYDTYGRLTKEESAKSSRVYTKYTYAATQSPNRPSYYGLIKSETHELASGRTLTYTYTPDSDKKTIKSSSIRITKLGNLPAATLGTASYTYDRYGNVKKAIVNDVTTSYSYTDNVDGRSLNGIYVTKTTVDGVLNSAGNKVENNMTYDDAGNVVKLIDAENNTTLYTYDTLNRITGITYPNGSTVNYDRNDIANTLTYTTLDGAEIKNTYDKLGNLVSSSYVNTDGTLIPISEKSYDSCGNISTEKIYTSDNKCYTVEYTYDIFGRVLNEIYKDSLGGIQSRKVYEYTFGLLDGDENTPCIIDTVTVYNNANYVVSKKRNYTNKYSETVMTCSVVGENEIGKTYTEYDNESQKTAEYYFDSNNTKVYTAKYTYDGMGRVIANENADGNSVRYTFDNRGNKLTETDYLGNKTTYTYDVLDRVTEVSAPLDKSRNGITKNFYDGVGNLIKEQVRTDYNNSDSAAVYSTKEYSYDSMGNMTDSVAHENGTVKSYVHYKYTPGGKTSEVYTGLSSPYSDTLTADDYSLNKYFYDIYGNNIKTTDALDNDEVCEYNAYGRIIKRTDRNGTEFRYTYDDLGNTLSCVVYENGSPTAKSTAYTYDGVNKLSVVQNGQRVSYVYDTLGRIVTETEYTDGSTSVRNYTYDDFGNKTSYTLSVNGEDIVSGTYSYDKMFRIVSKTEDGVTTDYTYDKNGKLISEESLDIVSENVYNKGGLIESKTNYVKNSAGVKTLASKFTYTFNYNGSVRSESSEIPGQSGILKEYVYDGAGRLSAETQTSTADNTVLYSGSFTYDRNGNRLTSTNTADGQSVTTAYTYDKNNRLTSTQTGSDVTLYTYDANGNTLTAGNKSYTYDEYNRQKRYEVDGSSKGVYEYSANGLRSVKNGRGLIWLGDKMVYEFGIGNGVRGTVYTYGFGIATADGETSYLKNAHGDVVQLVRNGAVVKNYRYNAFGEEIGIDENDENPFRYCGEYYDAESGTIYLRARYYNPANGRFTTLDPAMDGLNWYAYCGNEPVGFVDKNGLWTVPTEPKDVTHIIGGIAGELLSPYTKGGEHKDVFKVLGFNYNEETGTYHAHTEAWQQIGGYNDFYDVVFDYATHMRFDKFAFSYDNKDFIVWMWKGDYLNLGAGSEMGIYRNLVIDGQKTPHWVVDRKYSLYMSATLVGEDGYNILYQYEPTEKQWWITGFNPNYMHVDPDKLTSYFKLGFDNVDMYNAFKNQMILDGERWYFDDLLMRCSYRF